MKCERCQKEEAEVHIKQSIDGKVREFHLCRSCARDLAQEGVIPHLELDWPVSNLLGALWGKQQELMRRPTRAEGSLVCPQCGMSFPEFRKTGKFGCAGCYSAFRSMIQPLLRKIQGTTLHRGRHPGEGVAAPAPSVETGAQPVSEIERLREELRRAVEEERYEAAAELRDRIRSLEGKGEESHEG